MAVSFSQIPNDRREPGVFIEIDPSLAQRGLPGMPHKTLIIGQRLAAGAVAAGQLTLVTDPEQAAVAFGRGPMLHAMCAAYRDANDTTEMWAIALDDAGGATAGVKSVTISKVDGGADFGAGTLSLYVGGRLVRVGVRAGDTPAEVAAAIVAAADDPMIPAVLTVDGVDDTKVNATARNAGATAGLFDLRLNYYGDERLPANMNAAIAETTAGATDPTIDATLTAVDGEDWWTEIVTPYVDGANVAALDAFLTERFDALDMRDGIAFAAEPGSVSALFASGLTRNSPHMTVLPHQASPTPPWEMAAAYAGVAAFQTQIDPARQLKTLALPNILPPAVADRFTPSEMDMLLRKGISSTRVIGGEVRLWRSVTTYRVNDAGALDTAYLDLTTMTTLAYLRYSEANLIQLRFPRHKLADNGTRFGAGQAIVTPEIMRGELIGLYARWEEAGLVENAKFFADRLIVERDANAPNRLNSLQTPYLINSFRVFAGVIQFRL